MQQTENCLLQIKHYITKEEMEFKLAAAETKAEETSNEKLKLTKREARGGYALLSAAC